MYITHRPKARSVIRARKQRAKTRPAPRRRWRGGCRGPRQFEPRYDLPAQPLRSPGATVSIVAVTSRATSRNCSTRKAAPWLTNASPAILRSFDGLRRSCGSTVGRCLYDPFDGLQRVSHGRIADGGHLEDRIAFVDDDTLLPQRLPHIAGIHHTTRSICGQTACLILNSRDYCTRRISAFSGARACANVIRLVNMSRRSEVASSLSVESRTTAKMRSLLSV
jgi:hypothetical protein